MARRPKTEDRELDGVLAFMRVLWRLDHALQSRSKRMAAELGVTGPQRLALRLLGRSPGLTAGRLAEQLELHPSTLTGVLRRLEGRGLVQRRADHADRRRARLWLTKAGLAIDARRAGTVEAAVTRALRRVPAEARGGAERLLAAVVEELDVG